MPLVVSYHISPKLTSFDQINLIYDFFDQIFIHKPELNNSALHNLRIISLRDIRKGEEITVAYGRDFLFNKDKTGESANDRIIKKYRK